MYSDFLQVTSLHYFFCNFDRLDIRLDIYGFVMREAILKFLYVFSSYLLGSVFAAADLIHFIRAQLALVFFLP